MLTMCFLKCLADHILSMNFWFYFIHSVYAYEAFGKLHNIKECKLITVMYTFLCKTIEFRGSCARRYLALSRMKLNFHITH